MAEALSRGLACGVILVFAVMGRAMGGSWLAPGAFFPLVWVSYSVAAVFLAPLFPLCTFGLWAIVSMVLAFQAGALMMDSRSARWRPPAMAVQRPVPDWLVQRLFWVTVGVTAVSALGVFGLAGTGVA